MLCLLTGPGSCTSDDKVSAPDQELPILTLSFRAHDTSPQSIHIETDATWSYRISGDTDLCEVSRAEMSSSLLVTPHVNYNQTLRTARIEITIDERPIQAIDITQDANAETFLRILNDELDGDNPHIAVAPDPQSGISRYVILIQTNNRLTLRLCEDPGSAEASTTKKSRMGATRSSIEGCDWITYETDHIQTDEGEIQSLTLTCSANGQSEASRTACLEIVCGAGTENTVITKRFGITQLGATPSLVINAPEEGLVATYDQTEALTFSVTANIAYDCSWVTTPDWAYLTETTPAGGPSTLRNFSIRVAGRTETSDREARLAFVATEGDETLRRELRVVQTGAPRAMLSLDTSEVVFGPDEAADPKYITVDCSFSTLSITTRDVESGTEAHWLETGYDAARKQLVLRIVETSEQERRAVLTLHCGGAGNEASATLTVIQTGRATWLTLDPERVELDAQGTEQVVSVDTNLETWELLGATDEPAFTLRADTGNNTITIRGDGLESGMREHTYTVKAGELEKPLTVVQRSSYRVGDLYRVKGRPVGIVYRVDETGQHGMAYALTVYNLIDKYLLRTVGSTFRLDDEHAPLSRTDGLDNQRRLMSIPGWETICQMTKWTCDLGQSQGVEWYIPAIEELKEMLEAMSGAQYTLQVDGQSGTTYEVLPAVSVVNDAWNVIRALYKTYTTPENGYAQEQYVVFQWAREDYSGMLDGRVMSQYDGWTLQTPGDEMAERWFSSTVESTPEGYHTWTALFGNDPRGNGVLNLDSPSEATSEEMKAYAGSVHPICRF